MSGIPCEFKCGRDAKVHGENRDGRMSLCVPCAKTYRKWFMLKDIQTGEHIDRPGDVQQSGASINWCPDARDGEHEFAASAVDGHIVCRVCGSVFRKSDGKLVSQAKRVEQGRYRIDGPTEHTPACTLSVHEHDWGQPKRVGDRVYAQSANGCRQYYSRVTEQAAAKPPLVGLGVLVAQAGEGQRRAVWGPASVEMESRDGKLITMSAIEAALPQLMRRARLSVLHKDQLVGEIHEALEVPPEHAASAKAERLARELGGMFRTGMHKVTQAIADAFPKLRPFIGTDQLFVAATLYQDNATSDLAWKEVAEGLLDSFSISGAATEVEPVTRTGPGGERVLERVTQMDLSAVTLASSSDSKRGHLTATARNPAASLMVIAQSAIPAVQEQGMTHMKCPQCGTISYETRRDGVQVCLRCGTPMVRPTEQSVRVEQGAIQQAQTFEADPQDPKWCKNCGRREGDHDSSDTPSKACPRSSVEQSAIPSPFCAVAFCTGKATTTRHTRPVCDMHAAAYDRIDAPAVEQAVSPVCPAHASRKHDWQPFTNGSRYCLNCELVETKDGRDGGTASDYVDQAKGRPIAQSAVPGVVVARCGCNGGRRENIVPEEFTRDGSKCVTCGQAYTIIQQATEARMTRLEAGMFAVDENPDPLYVCPNGHKTPASGIKGRACPECGGPVGYAVDQAAGKPSGEEVECEACEGKRYHHEGRTKCTACSGTGKVRLDQAKRLAQAVAGLPPRGECQHPKAEVYYDGTFMSGAFCADCGTYYRAYDAGRRRWEEVQAAEARVAHVAAIKQRIHALLQAVPEGSEESLKEALTEAFRRIEGVETGLAQMRGSQSNASPKDTTPQEAPQGPEGEEKPEGEQPAEEAAMAAPEGEEKPPAAASEDGDEKPPTEDDDEDEKKKKEVEEVTQAKPTPTPAPNAGAAKPSPTNADLATMLEQAVAKAVQPLVDRIQVLEQAKPAPAAPASTGRPSQVVTPQPAAPATAPAAHSALAQLIEAADSGDSVAFREAMRTHGPRIFGGEQ